MRFLERRTAPKEPHQGDDGCQGDEEVADEMEVGGEVRVCHQHHVVKSGIHADVDGDTEKEYA